MSVSLRSKSVFRVDLGPLHRCEAAVHMDDRRLGGSARWYGSSFNSMLLAVRYVTLGITRYSLAAWTAQSVVDVCASAGSATMIAKANFRMETLYTKKVWNTMPKRRD